MLPLLVFLEPEVTETRSRWRPVFYCYTRKTASTFKDIIETRRHFYILQRALTKELFCHFLANKKRNFLQLISFYALFSQQLNCFHVHKKSMYAYNAKINHPGFENAVELRLLSTTYSPQNCKLKRYFCFKIYLFKGNI